MQITSDDKEPSRSIASDDFRNADRDFDSMLKNYRDATTTPTIAVCIVTFVGVLWLFGIGAGILLGIQYEATPAQLSPPLGRWPSKTKLTLSGQRPTLVMFVHPQCPCTRASLSELSLLMTHCRGLVDAQVLFLKPPSVSVKWTRSDLWNTARQIPGVVAKLDTDGIEHQTFLASASGEVFLYRQTGDLVFHGGITASRGHAGDNRGRTAIESFLLNRPDSCNSTPVFGCDLDSRTICTSKAVNSVESGVSQ